MTVEAFFRLHDGLRQEGPGSDEATREALRRLGLGPLPAGARVLDLGCGPGRQTLALAEALGVSITAVDLHPPFLATLEQEAARRGLAHLVETRVADFGALDEPPGSVDLIWSEGAVYHLGWAAGLRRWRPLLRPGGRMALTELSWIGAAPAPEAAAFWSAAYPTMGTVAANTAAAEAEGFRVTDTFALPRAAWTDYYGPLRARIAELRGEAERDPDLARAIEETERESALFEGDPESYGYVFYLLQAR